MKNQTKAGLRELAIVEAQCAVETLTAVEQGTDKLSAEDISELKALIKDLSYYAARPIEQKETTNV